MEVTEVTKFLANITPFNQLSTSVIASLSTKITVYYYQSQENVTINDSRLMLVRTGTFAVFNDQQKLLAKLEEGDFYGYQQLLTNLNLDDSLLCEEDGLVYWLPAEAFHELRYQYKNIDIFFQRLFSRRLHQYTEHQKDSHFSLKIEDIIQPNKIALSPDETVQQAAQLMTEKRVSSLLLEKEGRLVGIVTDRDFRSRVLAHNLPASTPLHSIMTPEPQTIDKQAYVFEAIQIMSQYNIHHLPVTDRDASYSMITTTDIIRSQQDHPVYLISEIHRQTTVEGLESCSLQIRSLAATLSKQLIPAYEASHIITTITDALTQQLIKLARQQLGDPPCVYSWLAFGSQARMDQGLNADQDNALLLEKEPTGEIERYFSELATFVCQGLARCGMRLCPGNIMATNPELRLSLKGWSRRFGDWISSPTSDALLNATIFFDVRNIDGSKALFNAMQQDIVARTQNNAVFLLHLAQSALQRTAPLGFLKHFILEHDGEHRKGLDLKKRGISLITDLVRVYSLSAGINEVNTRQRLIRLGNENIMDSKDSQNLLDAFDVLAQLRWDKHIQDLQQDHDITNLLDPSILSSLQRHQLKDSFAVINDAQAMMKFRFCREF